MKCTCKTSDQYFDFEMRPFKVYDKHCFVHGHKPRMAIKNISTESIENKTSQLLTQLEAL